MKKKPNPMTPFKVNRVALAAVTLVLTGTLLFLYSCKKDGGQSGNAAQTEKKVPDDPSKALQAALQSSAYDDLKSVASEQSFNDLDWSKVDVINEKGVPALLWISSKTIPSRYLIYNRKNGVINTRWVDFGIQNGSGKIVVTAVKGSESIETSVTNGRISAQRKTDQNGKVTTLNIAPANGASASKLKGFGMLSKTLTTNAECGGGFPPPPPGGGGNDQIADGGSDGSFTWTGVNELPEVTITSTSTSSSPFAIYSLYILMGNNASYGFNYAPNPGGGGGSGSGGPGTGNEATVTPAGGGVSTDAGFVKGKTPANGVARYAPLGAIYGGWQVNVSYTLKTTNGVTTPTVTALVASVTGAESMVTSFQTLTQSSTINGPTISFNFAGYDVYGVYGYGYHDYVTIDGTYNTSTGVYSIYVHRAP